MQIFDVTVFHPRKDREKKHRATRYIVVAADEAQAREAASNRCYRDVDFMIARLIETSDEPHVFDYGTFHYDPERYAAIRSHHEETIR